MTPRRTIYHLYAPGTEVWVWDHIGLKVFLVRVKSAEVWGYTWAGPPRIQYSVEGVVSEDHKALVTTQFTDDRVYNSPEAAQHNLEEYKNAMRKQYLGDAATVENTNV